MDLFNLLRKLDRMSKWRSREFLLILYSLGIQIQYDSCDLGTYSGTTGATTGSTTDSAGVALYSNVAFVFAILSVLFMF
jgi:hypothetical protein